MKNYKLHFEIINDSITCDELNDLIESYDIDVIDFDEQFNFIVEAHRCDVEAFVNDFNNKVFCDDEESRNEFESHCEFEMM